MCGECVCAVSEGVRQGRSPRTRHSKEPRHTSVAERAGVPWKQNPDTVSLLRRRASAAAPESRLREGLVAGAL